ncbi:MAG: cupin domain-containing protein [Desulfovibrio sp.]|nr:cupin domain-containing protein [Desulfovibrio sp.]
MIRRSSDTPKVEACMFGGPGLLHATQILTKDEFAGKGRLCNFCVLHPGEAIGVHGHTKEFEVYYILSGTGTYIDNGHEETVSAGDVTICYSGESHGMINASTEDLTFFALILFSD